MHGLSGRDRVANQHLLDAVQLVQLTLESVYKIAQACPLSGKPDIELTSPNDRV
jgi:hypothetical protein